MQGLIGWIVAFGAGMTSGVLAMVLAARRMRAALERRVITHFGALIDRRAALLGIQEGSQPRVDVDPDGELQLDTRDPFERLLQLADRVEEREHAQLGYVDTIRVSKEAVDESVQRRRDSGSR